MDNDGKSAISSTSGRDGPLRRIYGVTIRDEARRWNS